MRRERRGRRRWPIVVAGSAFGLVALALLAYYVGLALGRVDLLASSAADPVPLQQFDAWLHDVALTVRRAAIVVGTIAVTVVGGFAVGTLVTALPNRTGR